MLVAKTPSDALDEEKGPSHICSDLCLLSLPAWTLCVDTTSVDTADEPDRTERLKTRLQKQKKVQNHP